MRRRPLVVLVGVIALFGMSGLVGVSSAAARGHAPAAKPKPISSYCSESGDLCFGVLNRSGAVYFEITTYARYFNRYQLCVRPPSGAGTCRSFPIRREGAFWGSSVRWHRNYPNRGRGIYRVTWKLGTGALGPTLQFRLPLR